MSSRSKKAKSSRGPTIDRAQRARHAEKLFAQQWEVRRVRTELMRKFKVCERTADYDIALAREYLAADDADERPHRKRVMRSTWKRQYEACMKAGELMAANRALIELARLDGLNDPKRIELSGAVGAPRTDVNWNDVPIEDRRRLLAAMDEVDRIATKQTSAPAETTPAATGATDDA